MFSMFAQFFAALTLLFRSAERGAQAIDHLAEAAELHAKRYRDEVSTTLIEHKDI